MPEPQLGGRVVKELTGVLRGKNSWATWFQTKKKGRLR